MHYRDGQEARLGDVISIADAHPGRVVACLDRAEYSPAYPASQWAYLSTGILVETHFSGLVHYPDGESERIQLVRRGGGSPSLTDAT